MNQLFIKRIKVAFLIGCPIFLLVKLIYSIIGERFLRYIQMTPKWTYDIGQTLSRETTDSIFAPIMISIIFVIFIGRVLQNRYRDRSLEDVQDYSLFLSIFITCVINFMSKYFLGTIFLSLGLGFLIFLIYFSESNCRCDRGYYRSYSRDKISESNKTAFCFFYLYGLSLSMGLFYGFLVSPFVLLGIGFFVLFTSGLIRCYRDEWRDVLRS